MDLLNSFPNTVITSIMKHLPQEDLKQWRLVNKHWYDVCTVSEMRKQEKFVFHRGMCGGDMARLARHIQNCKRIRPTVEFHEINLARLPITIWSHFGETITSLVIHECSVDDHILARIILVCHNLASLVLQVDSQIFSSEAIDSLIAKGVKRWRLTTFKYFSRHLLIPDEVFDRAFRIFPNIEVLGRDFILSNTSVDTVVEFFAQHSQLVKLDVRIFVILTSGTPEVNSQVLKANLRRALSELFGLRSLHFESNGSILFNAEELTALAQSVKPLDSLNLHFRDFILDSTCSSYQFPSTEYNFLLDLPLIGSADCMIDASFEILRRCTPSLKYIDIFTELNPQDVDDFVEDESELKKLGALGSRCIRECFSKRRSSLGDRHLNYQFLYFDSPEPLIIPEISCSSLTVFCARCTSAQKCLELLETLSDQALALETLSLTAENSLCLRDYLIFLEKFENLQFLVLDNEWDMNDSDIENLFNECPELLYVICPSRKKIFFRSEQYDEENGAESWSFCVVEDPTGL